jgi:hypothetical protein
MRRKESAVAPQGGERREGGRGREPGAAQPDTFVRNQFTGRDFAADRSKTVEDVWLRFRECLETGLSVSLLPIPVPLDTAHSRVRNLLCSGEMEVVFERRSLFHSRHGPLEPHGQIDKQTGGGGACANCHQMSRHGG